MTTQNQLWFNPEQSLTYAELCNTLYERELARLAPSPPERFAIFPAPSEKLAVLCARSSQFVAAIPIAVDAGRAKRLLVT